VLLVRPDLALFNMLYGLILLLTQDGSRDVVM